jgi:type II secretory pathway pseudopilin PulG
MNRHGVALLFAVAVIAALGMISLTAFGLARLEREAGQAAVAEAQARGAAEAALADAMGGWPKSQTPVVAGQNTVLTEVTLPGPASGEWVVRALGGPIFAIRASGVRLSAAGQPIASVVIEELVRLDSLAPDSLIHPRKYPLGWRLLP